MTATRDEVSQPPGNDRLLFGMILGVVAFWLFAQTTLNIASTMAEDLGLELSVMNIAVSITALFSGIFIVVMGGLADRIGRVRIVQLGFVLSIVGSLLVGLAPAGALAAPLLILGRICQGLSAACHHAGEPGAREGVLGGRGPPARDQPMVDGLVGRVGLCGPLRGPDGAERRLALDLHRCAPRSR